MTETAFGELHSPFSGHWIRERPGALLTYRPTWPIAAVALAALAVLAVPLVLHRTEFGTVTLVAAAVVLGGAAAFALAWRDENLFLFDRRRLVRRRGFLWSPRIEEVPLDSVEAVVVQLRRAVRVRPGEVMGVHHCEVGVKLEGTGETVPVWSHTDSERVLAFGRLLAGRVGAPLRDERPEEVLEAERIWRQEMARLLGETGDDSEERTHRG